MIRYFLSLFSSPAYVWKPAIDVDNQTYSTLLYGAQY
jgi:hypothetical protein